MKGDYIMNTFKITSLSTVLILGMWTVGCEDNPSSEIVSISPSNGSRGVAKTTEIKVEFSESMNEMSCESKFALIMGNLEDMPSDFDHAISGTFNWDEGQSIMTFHSDSTLMDSVMYSICLKEGMEMHGNGMGMMMSSMSGHGSSTVNGIISKFETVK